MRLHHHLGSLLNNSDNAGAAVCPGSIPSVFSTVLMKAYLHVIIHVDKTAVIPSLLLSRGIFLAFDFKQFISEL
jgi:hypothetical protein